MDSNRRAFLGTVVGAATAGFAGCGSFTGSDGNGENNTGSGGNNGGSGPTTETVNGNPETPTETRETVPTGPVLPYGTDGFSYEMNMRIDEPNGSTIRVSREGSLSSDGAHWMDQEQNKFSGFTAYSGGNQVTWGQANGDGCQYQSLPGPVARLGQWDVLAAGYLAQHVLLDDILPDEPFRRGEVDGTPVAMYSILGEDILTPDVEAKEWKKTLESYNQWTAEIAISTETGNLIQEETVYEKDRIDPRTEESVGIAEYSLTANYHSFDENFTKEPVCE